MIVASLSKTVIIMAGVSIDVVLLLLGVASGESHYIIFVFFEIFDRMCRHIRSGTIEISNVCFTNFLLFCIWILFEFFG